MQLSIQNLSKTYANGVKALDNVSLEIPKGMFGLLGPNGAGKSTLMRTLATLQEADKGTVMLDKINVLEEQSALRKVLGYLPQEFGVYPKVSAKDLLHHLAILKGVRQKKQRNELVDALPTAGLDPGERNRFYNLLSEIGEQVIVILSTHIVEDVKELCNNMAIINQGQLLFSGKPSEGTAALKGNIWEKVMEKSTLLDIQSQVQIISKKLVAGKPLLGIEPSHTPVYA